MPTIDKDYILKRIPLETLEPLMTDSEVTDIDDEMLDDFISDADAIVDNAISERYIYPYEKTADDIGNKAFNMLRRWKFLITRFIIYSRKYDNEEMKDVAEMYKHTLTKLDKIRKGEIEIPGLVKRSVSPDKLIKTKHNIQLFTKQRLSNDT